MATKDKKTRKVVITKFGADWCSPCVKMKPELKKLRKAHPDWEIKEIDVDKDPKYKNITSLPTTRICVGTKCDTLIGGITKKDIELISYKL